MHTIKVWVHVLRIIFYVSLFIGQIVIFCACTSKTTIPANVAVAYVMDKEGGRLITPENKTILRANSPVVYNEGYAVITQNSLAGYVDIQGDTVIAPVYKRALFFSEGCAAVMQVDSTWGFIHTDGKMFAKGYRGIRPMREGFAAVQPSPQGLWGFIDKNGQVVIPPRFAAALTFHQGLCAVAEKDSIGKLKWGYIDTKGNYVIQPSYEAVAERFDEGLAFAVINRHQVGFIDKNGKWAIRPTFSLAEGTDIRTFKFKNGIAPVIGRNAQSGDLRWGLIDKRGQVKVPFQYQFIDANGYLSYKCMIAGIEVGGEPKCGVIDATGKWLIEPRYALILPFQEGLALAKLSHKGKMGYLKLDGKWAIPPRYTAALPFHIPTRNYFTDIDYQR